MRRTNATGIAGILMLLGGAFLFFRDEPPVPLWVTWLLGPLLWYVGFGVTCVWFVSRIFNHTAPTSESASAQVSRVVENAAPARGKPANPPLLREIPAMGGFILLLLLMISIPAKAADDNAGLFASKCAICHGPDGAGKTKMGTTLNIPDLTSAETQKQSDGDLVKTISKGKNKMPAYQNKLTTEQINSLVNQIRELGKKR